MATMTLMLAVPPGSDLNFNGPIEMYASDYDYDDFDDYDANVNNHVLNDDPVIPAHGSSPPAAASTAAASALPPCNAVPAPSLAPPSVDPYLAVKEMLWLLPGINDIVRNTLDRMEQQFAYNSVFFLKAVLDLQATYLSQRPAPEPSAVLDISLVVRLAEILSTRITRREKDGREKDVTSPSRELQLRTLISALTLLHARNVGKIDNDAYAKLLRDVSERDADNDLRHRSAHNGGFCTGEYEYLTRYACDLIRCMSSDMGQLLEGGMSSGAIHFMFAAGFINQLDGSPSKETLDEVFARITAPPSEWHKDIRHLYEGTAGAIALHQQAKSGHTSRPSQTATALAVDVGRSIIEKVEQELKAYKWNSNPLLQGMLRSGSTSAVCGSPRPTREAQLFVCGLLDLLNQLIATFPNLEDVNEKGKSLALRLIRRSEERVFRYKAFELIISFTIGGGETEYYNTMRSLELEIEDTARASGYFDTRTDEQKTEATDRVEQVKREKREAMERCEKKMILFKGASESMQRRLQRHRSRGKNPSSHSIDEMIRLPTPWDDSGRSSANTASPVPSSQPSHTPTLSSRGQSCESSDSLTATPICEGSVLSPTHTEASTCKSIFSPTDTYRSVFSPVSPMESPILPGVRSPRTPFEAPEAITPGFEPDVTFTELSALFSGPGLALLDDMEEDTLVNGELSSSKDANVRKLSIELPIQTFESEGTEHQRAQAHMSREMPFRKHTPQNSMGSVPEDSAAEPSPDVSQSSIEPSAEPSVEPSVEPPLESPNSMYAEPSLTRAPTNTSTVGSLRRRSRSGPLMRPKRRTVQLDKPLPPIFVPERNKYSILAERAPEPVVPNMPPLRVTPREIPRSQSAMDMRSERLDMRSERLDVRRRTSSSSLGVRPNDFRGFTPMTPIIDNGCESLLRPSGPSVEYGEQPKEIPFKVHPKDNCFKTVISTDARYAVFLSPHSFQVYSIPCPDESVKKAPIYHYRLGDWEGLKKGKVQQTYRSVAASERYVVTLSQRQMQVHDLRDDNRVVYNDWVKGWEFSCVDIAADKLVVGLRMNMRGESAGMIRIYRMNAPTYGGWPFEFCGKIHLPINPRHPQDSPHLLSLSADGNYLTAGTPKFGYYFAWNISRNGDHKLIVNGQLRQYQGPGAETLTGATLFPDSRHIFCSTFPLTNHQPDWSGSFTEPVSPPTQTSHTFPPFSASSTTTTSSSAHRTIRQVSVRIKASTVSPHGSACAFLSKNGTIWVAPMAYVESDEVPADLGGDLTSFAPIRSKERLLVQASAVAEGGAIRFTPTGERLVAVDRKGKILLLCFKGKEEGSGNSSPRKEGSLEGSPGMPPVEAGLNTEKERKDKEKERKEKEKKEKEKEKEKEKDKCKTGTTKSRSGRGSRFL